MNANPHLLWEFLNNTQHHCGVPVDIPSFRFQCFDLLIVLLFTFYHTHLTKYWNVSDLKRSSTNANCHVKARCLATFIMFFSDVYCMTPAMHSTRPDRSCQQTLVHT